MLFSLFNTKRGENGLHPHQRHTISVSPRTHNSINPLTFARPTLPLNYQRHEIVVAIEAD